MACNFYTLCREKYGTKTNNIKNLFKCNVLIITISGKYNFVVTIRSPQQ